jgi:hypothetical protein
MTPPNVLLMYCTYNTLNKKIIIIEELKGILIDILVEKESCILLKQNPLK